MQQQGYTLIELLISVALAAIVFSFLAIIVPRATGLSRADILSSSTNAVLTRTSRQLVTDVTSGQPIILKAASTNRLDILKFGKSYTFALPPGRAPTGLTTLQYAGNDGETLIGKDLILTNDVGDYLITRVTGNAQTSAQLSQLTFSCPINLSGDITAHAFSEISLAHGSATGSEAANNLYRRAAQGGTWEAAMQGIQSVTFTPMYGNTAGTFTATPTAPSMVQTVNGQAQPMTAINFALTTTNGQTSPGSIPVRLGGTKLWACGASASSPSNVAGKLQINITVEGSTTGIGDPNVTITGPTTAFTLHHFGTKTYNSLDPGRYNATADDIEINGIPYSPVITSNTANINSSSGGTISIDYQVTTGILNLKELLVGTNGGPNLPMPAGRSAMINGSSVIYKLYPVDNNGSIDKTKPIDMYTLTQRVPARKYQLVVNPHPFQLNGFDYYQYSTDFVTISKKQQLDYTVLFKDPNPPAPPAPPTATAPVAPPKAENIQLELGEMPQAAVLKIYELKNGSFSLIDTRQLNGNATYELSGTNYYALTMNASQGGRDKCGREDGCGGGGGIGPSELNMTYYGLTSRNEAQNTEVTTSYAGEKLNKYKAGSITNYGSQICTLKRGGGGSGQPECETYQPNLVNTNLQVVLNAARSAIQNNAATLAATATRPQPLKLSDYFSANGLNAMQQGMWSALTFNTDDYEWVSGGINQYARINVSNDPSANPRILLRFTLLPTGNEPSPTGNEPRERR